MNDEQLRYKETVKLILARYCDEKAAAQSEDHEVSLQVYAGSDLDLESVLILFIMLHRGDIAELKPYSNHHQTLN